MISNFTNDYQFTTRMHPNHVNVEAVPEAKLLGTHITNDLKQDKNTHEKGKHKNGIIEESKKLQCQY